jgi:hypothetical protein
MVVLFFGEYMEFESTIGKRKVNRQLKQFTVDSVDHLSDEEIVELENQQMKEKEEPRLSDFAKKRIGILANLTRLEKTIKIGEYEFVVASLKTKEYKEAVVALLGLNGMEEPFELKKQILIRFIKTIDGLTLSEIIGSNDIEDHLLFIDELEEYVTTRLYNEYILMKNEINSKYTIKNEKDAKEVVEDIKK